MKKVFTWLKEIKWYGWTGAVWKVWVWGWPIYMVLDAFINFYQATYDTDVWAVVAIWKITCVFFWVLFHALIRDRKVMRDLELQIRKIQDDHIEFLETKLQEARDEITRLNTEKANGST